MANQVKVWDPLVRVFHWGFAGCFAVSYLSAEEWETVHVYSGYSIATLLLIRLIWGLVGTPHARFRDFVAPPREVLAYIRSIREGRPRRYLGHNPLGGLMVVALLLSVGITASLGLTLLAADEGEGPLSPWIAESETLEENVEEVHEFFANTTLFLVVLHIGGVIFSSRLHHENLVKAMFTGRKPSLDDNPESGEPGKSAKISTW